MTKIIRLILIILLFTMYACKPKIESLPKEIADQYMISFVQNPNGIAYYKDPTDLKSKIGVIPYKAMFGTGGRQYQEGKSIDSVNIWYENKEGYIFTESSSQVFESDVICFFSLKDDFLKKDPIGIVESTEATLYNAPFIDTRKIISLNQFNVVKDIKSSTGQKNKWYRVTDLDGRIGYIEAGKIKVYDSHSEAYDAANKGYVHKSGFIKIKTESPDILTEEEFKNVMIKKDSFIYDTLDLYRNEYSQIIKGKRYYSIYAKYFKSNIEIDKKMSVIPKELLNKETLFISEESIEFLSGENFSTYTIQHTNFKGDVKMLTVIAKEYSESNIDLTNVISFPLGMTTNKDSFYLVQITSNFSHRNFILRKSDGNYFATNFINDDYQKRAGVLHKNDIQDIDGDGVYEFILTVFLRNSSTYSLFGMRDGKYKMIGDIDSISNKTNGIIENINFIYNEEDYSFYKRGFRASGSFRYDKGNLIPVKIKYRSIYNNEIK